MLLQWGQEHNTFVVNLQIADEFALSIVTRDFTGMPSDIPSLLNLTNCTGSSGCREMRYLNLVCRPSEFSSSNMNPNGTAA